MSSTRWLSPHSLAPDPLNEKIYGVAEPTDLLASIREQGVLEPIVCTPELTIVSGHRRYAASIALGLATVPVRIDSVTSSAKTLIAFNRQRRKTWTQLGNEIDALLPECRRAAAQRATAARKSKASRVREPRPAHRAIDDVAAQIGIAREAVRQLLFIRQSRSICPGVDEIIRKLDAETWSLNRAYVEARRMRMTSAEIRRGAIDPIVKRCVRAFDLWQFRQRETAFDIQPVTPGTPAPQVFVNAVHHFSGPSDLIVDPFANDGIVGRIARHMGRRAACSDLTPRHKTVRAWDARTLAPWIERESAALLVLDPPYGGMMTYSSDARDLSGIESESVFQAVLQEVCVAWADALRCGGRLALLIGNEVRDATQIDRSFAMTTFLSEFLEVERRIWVPYPQSTRMSRRVRLSAATKCLATRQCELIVAVKRATQRRR